MRWGTVTLLLALLGCERGGLRPVLGELQVSPAALQFEPAFLGFPTRQTLLVRNGSRADRAVTVAVTGPFSAASQLTLPGGAELSVPVQFVPIAEGSAVGTLEASDGQARLVVALAGQAARPPSCAPSAPCQTSRFDPAAGGCVEAIAADGSACSSDNACFQAGSCAKGLCLGTARDCGDADRCTVDACDPASGCLHLPVRCPAPTDPCKVARCESALGCVETDAPDGTPCGASDCSTARVCLLGQCQTRPVPDGASCAPATACQGAGICRQQQCERPAQLPLTEAWSYEFPGNLSGFRGVTDAAENLYWVECAFGGLAGQYCNACTLCAATSFTRDGALRFRRLLIGSSGYEQEPLHLLAGGNLIYAMPYSVGAVAAATGTQQWARDFYSPLPGAPDVANSLRVHHLAADASGVYLLAARYQNTPQDQRQSALLKLDPATGATLFTRFFDGELIGAVIDELDNLYLGFTPRTTPNPVGPPPLLVSFTGAGVERWRVVVPAGAERPLAAYGGEVILQGGEVRSALDGALRAAAPGGYLVRNPLVSLASRTLLREPPIVCCPECSCPPPMPRVDAIAIAPGVAAPRWESTVASSNGTGVWGIVSDAVATRRGELLVAGGAAPGFTALKALGHTGAERFACEIPPTVLGGPARSRFDSPVALLAGRWAVVETIECSYCLLNPRPRLRVFELPGETPTRHGWVGAQGSPAGTSRPLP